MAQALSAPVAQALSALVCGPYERVKCKGNYSDLMMMIMMMLLMMMMMTMMRMMMMMIMMMTMTMMQWNTILREWRSWAPKPRK